MDRSRFEIPVGIWTSAPRHEITCLAAGYSSKAALRIGTARQSESGGPLSPRLASSTTTQRAKQAMSMSLKPIEPEPSERLVQCEDRIVVSGSDSGELCMWKESKGKLKPTAIMIGRQAHASPATCISFFTFEYQSYFITGFFDGMISVHDADSGDAFAASHVLPDRTYPISFHVFNEKKEQMVTVVCICCEHDVEAVKHYHHEHRLNLYGRTEITPSMIKPCNKIYIIRIGIGDSCRGIMFINTFMENPHDSAVLSSSLHSYSHDQSLMLALTSDLVIRVWDLATMTSSEVSEYHHDSVASIPFEVQFSPSGSHFMIVTSSGVLLYKVHLVGDNRLFRCEKIHEVNVTDLPDPGGVMDGAVFIGESSVVIWRICGPLYEFFIQDASPFLVLRRSLDLTKDNGCSTSTEGLHRIIACLPDTSEVFQAGGPNISIGTVAHWNCDTMSFSPSIDVQHLPAQVTSISDSFKSSVDRSQSVSCTYLFDSCAVGLVLAVGHYDGSIAVYVSGHHCPVQKLVGHNHRITSFVGVPAQFRSFSADSGVCKVPRPPLLASGCSTGQLMIWRMDTMERVASFHFHAFPVIGLSYHSYTDRMVDYLSVYCENDNSFSVYEIKASVEESRLCNADDLVKSGTEDSDKEIFYVRTDQVHNALFIDSSFIRISVTKLLLCTCHDSPVISVLSNNWTVQCGYWITVTSTGLVYIWVEHTGHLDRILASKEGKRFLQSRGLYNKQDFVGLSIPVSLSHQISHLSHDAAELVGNLCARYRYPCISYEKNQRDTAFGLIRGLTRDLNLEVFCIDIQTLVGKHCIQAFDLDFNSRELQGSKHLAKSDEMPEAPIDLAAAASEVKEADPGMELEKSDLPTDEKDFRPEVVLSPRRKSYSRSKITPSGKESMNEESTLVFHDIRLQILIKELRTAISFLLDWGTSLSEFSIPETGSQLGIQNPSAILSSLIENGCSAVGILGSFPFWRESDKEYDRYSLTILLPQECCGGQGHGCGRWKQSERFSAVHSLAVNAMAMSLLACGSDTQQKFFTTIFRLYSRDLPRSPLVKCSSSLMILGFYCLHEDEGIHLSARLLIQGIVEKMSAENAQLLFGVWSDYFQILLSKDPFRQEEKEYIRPLPEFAFLARIILSHTDQLMIAIYILSSFILSCPSVVFVENPVTGTICQTLLKFVHPTEDRHHVCTSLAIDLLGKGISVWKRFTTDTAALLLSLIRLIENHVYSKSSEVKLAATRALLEIAHTFPKVYVNLVGTESIRPNASSEERTSAILTLVPMSRKYPLAILPLLPRIVETVVRCLDPAEPAVRKALLRSCTSVLRTLTKVYPMVSFNQKSQLFAVGTDAALKGVMVIYDLRTAIKWKVIEGHSKGISAVAFNDDGSLIASYSQVEDPPSLRVWKTGHQSLITSLLGIHSKCLRTFHLKKLDREVSTELSLKNCNIAWTSTGDNHSIKLAREDGSVVRLSVKA